MIEAFGKLFCGIKYLCLPILFTNFHRKEDNNIIEGKRNDYGEGSAPGDNFPYIFMHKKNELN